MEIKKDLSRITIDFKDKDQSAISTKSNNAKTSKVKITFYVSDEINQALIEILFKRLRKKQKSDKSAIISEALQLLINKELA
jgi:hypothetical protein